MSFSTPKFICVAYNPDHKGPPSFIGDARRGAIIRADNLKAAGQPDNFWVSAATIIKELSEPGLPEPSVSVLKLALLRIVEDELSRLSKEQERNTAFRRWQPEMERLGVPFYLDSFSIA